MPFAGIDAGSRTIKVAIIADDGQKVIASGWVDQGLDLEGLAIGLFEKVLGQAGLSRQQIGAIVATGYGRGRLRIADRTITEITAQAIGVRSLMPDTRTIIDIGGQDSKLILLDNSGHVHDFVMNDRCAAGTGRFLEIVAQRLELDLQDLGGFASGTVEPAVISNICAVFAETEIIGLLGGGRRREDIVAGIEKAIASRIHAMAARPLDKPVVLTGGVALVGGMQQSLEAALGVQIDIAPCPLMTAAIGAAIVASKTDGSIWS